MLNEHDIIRGDGLQKGFAPPAREVERKHFKTEGEHKFNWETYTRIGYFANVAGSLAAVFWAERTPSGQAFIRSIGRGFEKLGTQREKAEFFARKSFFLAGGFAVIPVMKWLEDHKAERVKKYNREIYGDKADTDPLIVQSEREVEQAPRQGWASILTGRGLALLPFYGTTMLLWSSTSLLSRMTNPELAMLGKAGRRAMQHDNPEAFAKLSMKGWFFDKPLARLTRDIGKLTASGGKYFDTVSETMGLEKLYHGILRVAGKPMRLFPESKTTVQQIEHMETISPGSIQSVKQGAHDPIHAVMPYYFISEAITSAIVAWGLYLITRVTGPIFDKKPHEATEPVPQALVANIALPETGPSAHQPRNRISAATLQAGTLKPAQTLGISTYLYRCPSRDRHIRMVG
jgi:hypothetical protein